MALVRTQIGRCKKCGKSGPMLFTNHKQSQDYCDLCKPIVKQQRIHDSIWFLKENDVTPEMYKEFYERED